MYCEQPPPKPPKPTCRCKNCVLRPEDIVPWTDLMGMSMADREGTPSRRVSTRTRQSWDSVYTIADGDPQEKKSHVDQQGSHTPVEHTPVRNGGNTPSGHGTPREVSSSHPPPPPPAQPTILLIVVNKPEPPAYPGRGYPGSGRGYPGSGQGYPGSGRGYPGSAPGYPGSRQGYPGPRQEYPGAGPGYPGSGPGYPGQAPRGYPGPGPRRSSGPGGTPNGYNYPPPGPGPSRRVYEDRFRNDGYGPYQNDSRYPEDWRRQSRGYPNNGYADPPRNRRPPDNQRSCRCPGKNSKTELNEDRLQASGNRDVNNRLEGSGNPRPCNCKSEESYPKHNTRRRPRNCRCEGSEISDFSLNAESSQNIQDDFEEREIEEDTQEVVVTDGKNKTFKCIQVPICISVGKPDCCRCCKCAAAAPAPDSESQSGKIDKDEDEECNCNPQGKCTCVDDTIMPDEFACECNLTNLERTLRNLIPNADCMCYLKKKRRRRRKKWAPKVFYDRFANPPFVLNPKPRCLEYGCSPCCNPCFNRCCCAPVAKSCYNCDYRCGGGC